MDCRPGLFFTGTDTGVGKTFVTAAVARLLRRQGRPVQVCKPVATGARLVGGRWLSDDTQVLADAAGDDPERVTRWAFPDPVAPPVAARRQGVRLSLAGLIEAVRGAQGALTETSGRWDGGVGRAVPSDGPVLLVEGVGGLLCPLTDTETVADLVTALQLPLVVVARRSLGTLNHTLLTLEVARARGHRVAGVVVNEVVPPTGLADETNVEELIRRLDVPILAVVAHGREEGLAAVNWWLLCHGEFAAGVGKP
jgi:dethiobiotin synthetase